jgi:GT2 family glycosyltransferase
MESKVTAIVSAYHDHTFLEKRINNLRFQQPSPEIIIVCKQGSNEWNIANDYADVHIIPTENIPTIYKAWNMSIEQTKTPYVTNANCDDMLYPSALAIMQQTLDDFPDCALVYADCNYADKNGITSWKRPVGMLPCPGGKKNIYNELKRACFIGSMPMWRANLHDKYGYFDDQMMVCGDYDFWMRLAKSGELFYYIDRPLGIYAYREESLYNRNKQVASYEVSKILERYANRR